MVIGANECTNKTQTEAYTAGFILHVDISYPLRHI